MVKILVVPAAPRMNLTSSDIRSATAVLDLTVPVTWIYPMRGEPVGKLQVTLFQLV
jgi:hypothetical protein